MGHRTTNIFLILVILQAAHSVEEYVGRLWEVFAPARYLTGLISKNHDFAFLVLNIGFIVFGIICWLFILSTKSEISTIILWFWIIIELINGIGHTIYAIFQKEYIPGLITAPLIFTAALFLVKQMKKNQEV